MKKIDGTPKNLMGLLQNIKYTINYYQREYRWQHRQIEELINDLTTEFLLNYKPGHTRKDGQNYDIYFMGSIILAGRENEIVDGQQRLSSLTLLLMYLRNRLIKRNEHHPTVEQIIYSEVRGEKSFNINVPERQDCMTAIYNDNLDAFDTTDATESVKNLCDAYGTIEDNFPKEIDDYALLIFCDWLIEKVYFIEIVAQEESDASKIFITMNDRGLSLTPAEMLKSYLLSEIKSNTARDKLNKRWKATIESLKHDDDKGDETFIKAWLRAQYADIIKVEEINESRQINLFTGLHNVNIKEDYSDFSQISDEFHKWIRDNHDRLNLNTTANWERFIEEFFYFAKVYLRIRSAEKAFAEETKYVYYNAQLNFTLQPLFVMAPIRFNDDAATVAQKINLAARFIDLCINAQVVGRKSLKYNANQNYIFKVAKDIRGCSIDELKTKLQTHYDALNFDASAVRDLRLNNLNKRHIKNILARITSFIDAQTSGTPRYVEYMTATDNPFEIEHIICNDFDRYAQEFSQEEFDDWRNNIGALLLLRKSINSSLSDSDYPKKLVKYCSTDGNIYAASLGAQTYQNNPQFKKFIDENNLLFKPFNQFAKSEIQARVQLVAQLVSLIWNTEEFDD